MVVQFLDRFEQTLFALFLHIFRAKQVFGQNWMDAVGRRPACVPETALAVDLSEGLLAGILK